MSANRYIFGHGKIENLSWFPDCLESTTQGYTTTNWKSDQKKKERKKDMKYKEQ